MPFLETGDGRIWFDAVDITAPWVTEPETILFHHGVSTDSGLWSEWLPALVDKYRIVRFDLRGFGKSDDPGAEYEWGLDKLIDDTMAIADAAECTRFHMVGESTGGTVAVAAAARRADRLLSVTASNAAYRGASVRNVQGNWDQVIERDGQDAWAAEMMKGRFFPNALTPEKFDWFERQHATCAPHVTLGLASMLLATDLSAEVGGIDMPMLLFSPDSSPFVAVEEMNDLRDAVKNAELKVFPHARHGLPLSHGLECGAALRAFLDRHFPG